MFDECECWNCGKQVDDPEEYDGLCFGCSIELGADDEDYNGEERQHGTRD